MNSSVLEKPEQAAAKAGKKAAKTAGDIWSHFSFDPHPNRTKFVYTAKVVGATLMVASIFGSIIKRGH